MPAAACEHATLVLRVGRRSREGNRKVENCGWGGVSGVANGYAPTACAQGSGWKWRRTERAGATRTAGALDAWGRTSERTGGED